MLDHKSLLLDNRQICSKFATLCVCVCACVCVSVHVCVCVCVCTCVCVNKSIVFQPTHPNIKHSLDFFVIQNCMLLYIQHFQKHSNKITRH